MSPGFSAFYEAAPEGGRYTRDTFFHCGEYGEKLGRPHYHACVFNYDFSDKVHWSMTGAGHRLYRSSTLERLWPMGHALVGDVTFDSAAYVARYVMKKVTGVSAVDHYVNKVSGEVLSPEYVTMSRRPGIGKAWYDQYKSDIYPEGVAVMRGMRMQPPKFYDGLFELDDPVAFKALKCARSERSAAKAFDNDSFRLAVKEECKAARVKLLSRSMEDSSV